MIAQPVRDFNAYDKDKHCAAPDDFRFEVRSMTLPDEIICRACPRNCGAVRTLTEGGGFCGAPLLPRIARAAPHMWEEPVISGRSGSGTVFFSGCSLRCVFCQNYDVSAGNFGKTVTVERLREIFQELIALGVHNVNLVTADHYVDAVLCALDRPLPVPVVWNSGGYQKADTLRRLEGKVQIYLPDMKYSDSEAARRYSAAPDYPDAAKAAITEMYRQTGPYVIKDGIMKSGVIIRHLVLPGQLKNTYGVIDWVADTFGPGQVLFSLMSQYTPMGRAANYPEIDRRITSSEYRRAREYMEKKGVTDGFYQEKSSAKEEYTPPFDLTGVE